MREALTLFFAPLAVLGFASPRLAGAILSSSVPLDSGFRQMYDLQFEEAHRTFSAWEQLHPDDPLGPTSDAAAYLFSELDRLGVLQSELFVDDEKFKESPKLTPDPATRQAFDKALARSDQVADAVLARSPHDGNALLAKIMNLGLRSDYLALIEKRYLASLGYMKSAGDLAEKLLPNNPSYYDRLSGSRNGELHSGLETRPRALAVEDLRRADGQGRRNRKTPAYRRERTLPAPIRPTFACCRCVEG